MDVVHMCLVKLGIVNYDSIMFALQRALASTGSTPISTSRALTNTAKALTLTRDSNALPNTSKAQARL